MTEGSAEEGSLLASGIPWTKATTGGVAGCGDDAVGDPADDSPNRKPARCAPGAPAPKPLAEKTKLKVQIDFKIPTYSAVLLAERLGEFEKENLDVEIVKLSTADAYQLLATGDLDIGTGGIESPLFNAVAGDLGIKMFMGANYVPSAGDLSVHQTGIWARADAFTDPDNPDLAELKGKTLGTSVGMTSVIMLPVEKALNAAGISVNDMHVQKVPGAETVQALENNAVQASWVLDPYWKQLAGRDDFLLVATGRPGEQLGGYLASPEMLDEKRDAAVAFTRAVQRTINTYFTTKGVPKDDATTAEVAAALEMTPEVFTGLGPYILDWELRSWTVEDAQDVFMSLDQLTYKEPMPIDDIVDRTIYLDAIGAK